MDKKIVDSALAAIEETYGYKRPGVHLKQCQICGGSFEEPNDLSILILKGPFQCPHCKEVLQLQEVLIKHWNEFQSKQTNDPIEQRNFIKNPKVLKSEYVTTEVYELDDYDTSCEIVGRSKFVRRKIELIAEARNQLYFQLDGQLKILESIYERKDRFWNDGVNLPRYVGDASFQVLVIKLREFLGGNSKYSYTRIRNELRERRKSLYEDHKIIEVRKFKQSGEIMKTEFRRFPIEEYLTKLETVINTYQKEIDAIIDFRDGMFAHLGVLKREESKQYMTFRNVKRILNSLKIIYDGFLYSVAPDLYTNLRVEHAMPFNRMNRISQFWEDHHK